MRAWGWAVAIAVALAGSAAAAEPGLANKVYDPYVRKGVTEVELRGGRLAGGPLRGESGAVLELEHGISDRVSLAILAEWEHPAHEATRLDAIAVEGVAYLGQIPGLGVDVGGYLEYEQRIHNESGVLEGKLLLAKHAGRVHGLLNLIVEKPLTDRSDDNDTEFGYAAQVTVDAPHNTQLGVQAFGDLGTDQRFGGRQPHYLGPVAKWEVRPGRGAGELEFEAAWLWPLGAARDVANGQARFVIEYERRF